VIEVGESDGSLALYGRLPEASSAYVDADWLGRGGDRPAALLVTVEGGVSWLGRPDRPIAAPGPPEAAVGLVLDALARAAADAARAAGPGSVHIGGRGLVAEWVRARLGIEGPPEDQPPSSPRIFVDTTGRVEAVLSATHVVDDVGTVVLAGGLAAASVPFDLYPDVHVRGLRIVGVTPPLADSLSASGRDADTLAKAIGEAQRPVRPGEAVPSEARLYRFDA
jgi:hypothetical protein